jgi:hypothetical protein
VSSGKASFPCAPPADLGLHTDVLLKNLDYQGVVGEIDVDHADSDGLLLTAPMARAFSLLPGVHMKHAVRDVRVEKEDPSRKV